MKATGPYQKVRATDPEQTREGIGLGPKGWDAMPLSRSLALRSPHLGLCGPSWMAVNEELMPQNFEKNLNKKVDNKI